MEHIDPIYKSFMILSGVVAIVAWFSRLESKTAQNTKDIAENKSETDEKLKTLKADAKEKEVAIWNKIDRIQADTQIVLQTLSRIEESLRHIKRDQ